VRNNTYFYNNFTCTNVFHDIFNIFFFSNRNVDIGKQFSPRTLIQRHIGFIRLRRLAYTSIYVKWQIRSKMSFGILGIRRPMQDWSAETRPRLLGNSLIKTK